jgi:hypothetical protein
MKRMLLPHFDSPGIRSAYRWRPREIPPEFEYVLDRKKIQGEGK